MAVSCYHVWQLLLLAWFNLALDWIIFHPEPVLLLAVLIIAKKTKSKLNVHVSKKESEESNCTMKWFSISLQVRNKFLLNYADVCDGIGCFSGPPYHIQVDPSVIPNQTPCWPIPVHLKEAFKKEIDKMLQVGVLKPVNQATPWMNSFVLVEGKDKQGNLKLRVCLDPDQS